MSLKMSCNTQNLNKKVHAELKVSMQNKSSLLNSTPVCLEYDLGVPEVLVTWFVYRIHARDQNTLCKHLECDLTIGNPEMTQLSVAALGLESSWRLMPVSKKLAQLKQTFGLCEPYSALILSFHHLLPQHPHFDLAQWYLAGPSSAFFSFLVEEGHFPTTPSILTHSALD